MYNIINHEKNEYFHLYLHALLTTFFLPFRFKNFKFLRIIIFFSPAFRVLPAFCGIFDTFLKDAILFEGIFFTTRDDDAGFGAFEFDVLTIFDAIREVNFEKTLITQTNQQTYSAFLFSI